LIIQTIAYEGNARLGNVTSILPPTDVECIKKEINASVISAKIWSLLSGQINTGQVTASRFIEEINLYGE
jgi:hypothetical protein